MLGPLYVVHFWLGSFYTLVQLSNRTEFEGGLDPDSLILFSLFLA